MPKDYGMSSQKPNATKSPQEHVPRNSGIPTANAKERVNWYIGGPGEVAQPSIVKNFETVKNTLRAGSKWWSTASTATLVWQTRRIP